MCTCADRFGDCCSCNRRIGERIQCGIESGRRSLRRQLCSNAGSVRSHERGQLRGWRDSACYERDLVNCSSGVEGDLSNDQVGVGLDLSSRRDEDRVLGRLALLDSPSVEDSRSAQLRTSPVEDELSSLLSCRGGDDSRRSSIDGAKGSCSRRDGEESFGSGTNGGDLDSNR